MTLPRIVSLTKPREPIFPPLPEGLFEAPARVAPPPVPRDHVYVPPPGLRQRMTRRINRERVRRVAVWSWFAFVTCTHIALWLYITGIGLWPF